MKRWIAGGSLLILVAIGGGLVYYSRSQLDVFDCGSKSIATEERAFFNDLLLDYSDKVVRTETRCVMFGTRLVVYSLVVADSEGGIRAIGELQERIEEMGAMSAGGGIGTTYYDPPPGYGIDEETRVVFDGFHEPGGMFPPWLNIEGTPPGESYVLIEIRLEEISSHATATAN